MAKTDLVTRLRQACDALSVACRRVQPDAWTKSITPEGYTPQDLVNYCMGLLELSGNTFLQSQRMEPVLTDAELDHEARRYSLRRRGREMTASLNDLLASERSLLVLVDMSDDATLAAPIRQNDRSRESWLITLAATLDIVTDMMRKGLGG
jgi:hypothetical protein